jgi:hypothetical protein
MLVLAAAMALPVGARAAEADTMSVTGQITAHTGCSMSIENGGNINYGVIPAASLNQSDTTYLGQRRLAVTIACETPTYIALKLHDLRADSKISSLYLGLGFTRTGAMIGHYTMTTSFNFETMTLNGSTGYVLEDNVITPNPGLDWGGATINPWNPIEEWRSFGYQNGGLAAAVSTAVFPLYSYAHINSLNELNLTGAERIDGQHIIEMFYM